MKRLFPLLVSGFALAASALAQVDFDKRAADVGLLQAKQIQAEVGVTAAQRAKMNAAADRHRKNLEEYEKQLKALGTTTPDKRKLLGFFETLKNEVFAALTPAQIRRLRELTLQRLGLIALIDEQVSKRVGLSPAQITKLKAAFQTGRTKFVTLQQSTARPILAPYEGRKPKSQAEATALRAEIEGKLKVASDRVKPQLVAIGKQTDSAMLSVLTPAQKAAWTAHKGRPFTAK
jgi:stress response protein YsnF